MTLETSHCYKKAYLQHKHFLKSYWYDLQKCFKKYLISLALRLMGNLVLEIYFQMKQFGVGDKDIKGLVQSTNGTF